jgi:serine/threonine protein kinase
VFVSREAAITLRIGDTAGISYITNDSARELVTRLRKLRTAMGSAQFVAGETLLDSRLSKKTISEALALRIVASVAAAISYLDENQVLHAPLRLTRILISTDAQARLAEIAVANPANAQTAPAKTEIQMLGRMLIPVVKADSSRESGHVLTLLYRMQSSGTDAIASWDQLKEETKKLEPIVGPPQAHKSSKTTNLIQKMKSWRSGS